MTVFLIFAALITNIILAASIIIMALYGAPVSALVAGASLALVSAIVPVAVDGIKRLRRNSRQSLPEVKDPVPKDMVTMDKALYESKEGGRNKSTLL